MIPDIPDLRLIVETLKTSDLSRRKIAKLVGVSQPTISKLYKGKEVRYSTVYVICQGLRKAMRPRKPQITVEQMCNPNLKSVNTTDRVKKAVMLMSTYNIDQVPVFEGREPVGSVESEELNRRRAEGIDYLELIHLPVTEVMRPSFPVVDSKENFAAVNPLLLARPAMLVRIRGKVSGILTWSDVVNPEKNALMKVGKAPAP